MDVVETSCWQWQSTAACCPRETIPDLCSCPDGCTCMCLDCECEWGDDGYEDGPERYDDDRLLQQP